MGKIKDFFNGPHKVFAWFLVVVTAIFLGTWIFGPGHTFFHWGKAGMEVRRQEKIIEAYEKENAELDRRTLKSQGRRLNNGKLHSYTQDYL